MFSCRRYLEIRLVQLHLAQKDNNSVPHHGTERFNCILASKHITNGRGKFIIAIVVYGVLATSSVKSLQLAERFIVVEALHVTETCPEAGSRKDDLQ
jgi:hypothetical protein